ncbi:phenoloxidase 1-like [Adelges cooleyi]|uniref:phenoloxidase 1-like n=1 Tax=Adelges cooleyi TaxID=133065 RepID=UPI002180840B|nr:phenoloxidase 1-like [Adelges cooleyi]XP_050441247.1 phenoloxidase 1-like [Adelges cooleyi]
MPVREATVHDLAYLFYRPTEPLFIGKGKDHKVVFDIPEEYKTDRHKMVMARMPNVEPITRFNMETIGDGGPKKIQVKKLEKLPDLSLPLSFKKDTPFTLFNPHHSAAAGRLITVLMDAKTTDELMSLAVYCRDRMNPLLFIYAMSVVMIHRPDTRTVQLPSHVEMFPKLYVQSSIFNRVLEEAFVPVDIRVPVDIPQDYTASNLDFEHKMAYFREDIGVNLHHWHWHSVYLLSGPPDMVNRDRRGELFSYMHQQILARYNFERFSNHINRVTPLMHWNEPILEGYFPKLDNAVSSHVWPARSPNTKLQNVQRQNPVDKTAFDIEELERWRDRLFLAIHSGFVINKDGQQVKLTETEGIDILGNMIEANPLSKNPTLYGNLHNNGHMAIGFIHDPDFRYKESYGVMADPATAMRDPIFYRWHSYINCIFQAFKATIPGYSIQNLSFENVTVQSIDVVYDSEKPSRNEFETFWQKCEVDLSRGLDFTRHDGPVNARFTLLQHTPFSYRIIVQNDGVPQMGTVRIFIAPKYDEKRLAFMFEDQRHFFVELDKFSTQLKSGRNEIERRSTESSVTIPFEKTYQNMDNVPDPQTPEGSAFNYCGCGWPQNMLIAKGTPEGLPCELFVMVSNGVIDQVEKSQGDGTCKNASSYCGVLDKKYPDARAMGYPFDRPAEDRPGVKKVETLQDFLQDLPNMAVRDVTIKFTGREEVRPPSSGAGTRF